MSFGGSFTSFSPQIFPVFPIVVAPFWSDVDISNGVGTIRYEVHTGASASSLLTEVNNFIRNETGSQFNGAWMLLAEWYNVPAFASPTSIVS